MTTQKSFLLKVIFLITVVAALLVYAFFFSKKRLVYATAGEKINLKFIVPKDMVPGEYVFYFENGDKATKKLCFCLTEKNTFPADCSGDVLYLNKNPGNERSVPSKIGTGLCNIQPVDCGEYATRIHLYKDSLSMTDTMSVDIGIRIPQDVKEADKINVVMNLYRLSDLKNMYKDSLRLEKSIVIKNGLANQ